MRRRVASVRLRRPRLAVDAQERDAFIEFSFGPTVLGGSTFDDQELGGSVHFRSALALGASVGRYRNLRVALRVEHISNGGIRDPNPGLDSIGLSVVSGFGGR